MQLVLLKCNLSHDINLTFRVTLDSIQKYLQRKDCTNVNESLSTIENNPKQIRTLIGLKSCFY